jgi:hypothetical protein
MTRNKHYIYNTMKHLSYLILLSLLLVSCGTQSGHFKIEGHFLNMNQGEFYVYNMEGGVKGIDTIKVEGGRFAYETTCEQPTVLMLVFPNFSEQPIFAESGKAVDIKADASHLKEMEVTGTDDNELMTKFRKQTVNASPPEIIKYAKMFIGDHPESAVGAYLVKKYFVQTTTPDYNEAYKLIASMLKEQPKNGLLMALKRSIDILKRSTVNSSIPHFTATDMNGKPVSDAQLRTGVAVINVWATWNYESQDIQRQLKQMQRSSGGKLKLLSISVDASRKDCKQTLQRDSVSWSSVCDERMFESPLLKQLGLLSVPDNIIIQNGRIIAHGLSANDLRMRLQSIIH